MKNYLGLTPRIGLALIVTVLCSIAHAAPPQAGHVYLIHPESASAAFSQRLGPMPGQPHAGRFAVVKLSNGAWGEGSYALVRVPKGLLLKPDDRVELDASQGDLLGSPGSGVVRRRLPRLVAAN